MNKNHKIKLLLAEDDPSLSTILKAYLEAKSYQVVLCENGQLAFEQFIKEKDFDFCIFDVMMPQLDGFELATKIRKIDNKIPILFLTAKAMQQDVLEGFNIGADDYITKPFSMEELLVRMEAVLRRSNPEKNNKSKDEEYEIGNYKFNYTLQILKIASKEQKLTSKEADLLKLFCENRNKVLDRSTALNYIWHNDSYFNARSMDVYISKLRKYLKGDKSIELMNVHGVGFKLVEK